MRLFALNISCISDLPSGTHHQLPERRLMARVSDSADHLILELKCWLMIWSSRGGIDPASHFILPSSAFYCGGCQSICPRSSSALPLLVSFPTMDVAQGFSYLSCL